MVVGLSQHQTIQDTGEAALEYEAQVVEKLLALTLKATKESHKINNKALITFESPQHGSFKSNAQVQALLRIEGFWLVEMDYCAFPPARSLRKNARKLWPTRHWMGRCMDWRATDRAFWCERKAQFYWYWA